LKINIHIGLLILFFGIISSQVFAQEYFFRNFSVEQGLSQSEVGDIVQDESGKLFIKTVSPGVDVFDGEKFSRITLNDGLLSPFVSKILKDYKNQIWFAGTKGLNKYRKDSILSFPFPENLLPIESIFCISSFEKEGLLLGTDQGLITFKNKTFNKISYSEPLRIFSIMKINEVLYLGTDSGLFEYSEGSIYRSTRFDIPSNIQILTLVADQNNKIYAGTQGGAYLLDSKSSRFLNITKSKTNAVISSLCRYDNKIILGTNGDGLAIIHPNGGIEYIDESIGLSDNYVWTLFEDKEKNLWIGTSGAGIDLFSEDQFQIFSTKTGLGNDIVYDIIEDHLGRIWFGIVQGGITIFDGKEFNTYSVEDGLSHRTVRCFFRQDEKIFIGTENGLTLYANGVFEDVSDQYGLRNYAIFDIHESKDGSLWFACKGERYFGPNGGVIRIKNGERIEYKKEDGLGSENVYNILERANGEIWFGTAGGTFVFKDEKFRGMEKSLGSICSSTVLTMAEDYKGNCWIGTIGGIGHFQDDSFSCLDEDKGTAGKTIFFLKASQDSNLWIGSSNGLEKLSLPDYYQSSELKTIFYNDQNGFYGSECNQNAVFEDSVGNLWFGTIKAAIKYTPKAKNIPYEKPNIFISNIGLNGEKTNWTSLGFNLDSISGMPQSLALKHDQNDLLFEYLGIYLKDPDALSYQFKLDGLANSEWSQSTDKQSIFYSNLDPGDYQFQVKVKNEDTGLSKVSQPYSFTIKPAIWQTNWFRAAMVLVLACVIYSLIQMRINNVRKTEKIKQEFQKQLHEVEMTALRAQMNPHFIFNSLNSINHFIIKNEKELASEYLTKFARLIRQVLQNSKEKLVSLEEELSALNLYVELEALRFKNRFDYSVNSSINTSHYKIPPLLLQPYVENAIWHGLLHLNERKGELKIDLSEEDNELEIVIEDNGIGRKKSNEMKSKSAIKKKSMGLKINSERLRLTEQMYSSQTSLKISDLSDAKGKAKGTKVVLKINYN